METVTLTYTHPVLGTITEEYEVVDIGHGYYVLRVDKHVGVITEAEFVAMHGVFNKPKSAVSSFISSVINLFK